jgi:hypothetical protein
VWEEYAAVNRWSLVYAIAHTAKVAANLSPGVRKGSETRSRLQQSEMLVQSNFGTIVKGDAKYSVETQETYRVLTSHRHFRHELRAELAHLLRQLLGQNGEVPAQPHGPAQVALVRVGLVGVGGGQAVAMSADVGLRDRGVACMDETVRKDNKRSTAGVVSSLYPGERGNSLSRAHNSAFTAQRQPTDTLSISAQAQQNTYRRAHCP